MSPSAAGSGSRRIPKRLLFSYIFDWIIIILIALAGGLFTFIPPNHRAFSLADPDISFPYKVNETISTATLMIVSLLVPALIICIICLVFVPGPTVASAAIPKSLIWRRKLWEWNTGWMGLGLSLAAAFMVTDGMKNLFGKPRPDLLSRCDADLANVQKFVIGGLGTAVAQGQYLVDWTICRQTDLSILNDGFASFPSGHSSFSWAGLGYLSLFLCSKFAITIPYLLPGSYSSSAFPSRAQSTPAPPSSHSNNSAKDPIAATNPFSQSKVLRSQAAAPPAYLLVLAFVPLGAAVYISSTRYSDYRHHGFDILFGSLLGIASAWGSFRWFHAPIRQGAGWSWGPRSAEKAWGVGLGVQGYSGSGWKREDEDLERGAPLPNGGILGEEGPANV